MRQISKREDMYGRPLPPTTLQSIKNLLELMGYEQEKEAPVKPKVSPDVAPDSPPAPDKDSPWSVPGPKINPRPKAFKKTLF